MKICAAQLRPTTGDVNANIEKHLELLELATSHQANLVFFPELSLTGYEPQLAASLASQVTDERLDIFQEYSDAHKLIIGVGIPLASQLGVQIGMLWFQPGAPHRSYAKQMLHADEVPFFVAGSEYLLLDTPGHKLSPAICYESLQMAHADRAAELKANVYLASVAKPASNLMRAMVHYPAVAQRHSMYVMMANCVGPSDTFISVGQSAAWSTEGKLLAQMTAGSEGVVMLDTITSVANVHNLNEHAFAIP